MTCLWLHSDVTDMIPDQWLQHLSVCRAHAWCLQRPEECVTAHPGTRVTDGYESPGGWWGLNLGPLEQQPLILATESSFEPQKDFQRC